MSIINKYIKDCKGATAIEYALILLVVSIVAIGAIEYASDETAETFNCTASAMGDENEGCVSDSYVFFNNFYEDIKVKNQPGYDPNDGINDDWDRRCAECNGYGGAGWVFGQTVFDSAKDAISSMKPELAKKFADNPEYMREVMDSLHATARKAVNAAGLSTKNVGANASDAAKAAHAKAMAIAREVITLAVANMVEE